MVAVGLVATLYPALATPWTIAIQASLSMGISQARILEWVTISFFRGSFQPRDRPQVSWAGGFFTAEPPGKPFTNHSRHLLSPVYG